MGKKNSVLQYRNGVGERGRPFMVGSWGWSLLRRKVEL